MPIRRAILLTLSYTSQFQYPLTARQLWQRLIILPGDENVDHRQFAEALLWLRDNKFILFQNGYFFLSYAKFDEKERKTRSLEAKKKLPDLEPLLRLCKSLPWVRAVAITGSMGVEQAKVDDDIDLLIVTSKNRLWITRMILIALAEILGKHRSRLGRAKSGWCFNLWLESDQLAVGLKSRSVYTAYEVIQAKWVLDKDAVRNWFYITNSWVKGILPNSEISVSFGALRNQSVSNNLFLNIVNALAYFFQRLYMVGHITRETVSPSVAFFHPRDTRGQIFDNWKQSLSFNKTVLVTGVFDILHEEHIRFLRASRSLGDKLVVGIESDIRVRRIKGKGRPINKSQLRKSQLEALGFIDKVIVLPEQFSKPVDHLRLLQAVSPSILAVSSHTPHLKEKRDLMAKIGGELRVVLEENPEISTTKLIARKELRAKK